METEKLSNEFLVECFEKLNKLWEDPKKRGFVKHLVFAYTPFDNIQKQLENIPKGTKCCITGKPLIDTNEMVNIIMDTTPKGFVKSLQEELKTGFSSEKGRVIKTINGRLQAYTGNDTTTNMCYDGVRAFIEWVSYCTLTNDDFQRFLTHRLKKSMNGN